MFLLLQKQRNDIRAAVAWARMNPVPIASVMAGVNRATEHTDTVKIEDRPPGWKRPQARVVMLPNNFRLAVSCEEQPVGICLHLSLSSPDPVRTLPAPEACLMVAQAAGIDPQNMPPGREWVEEFEVDGQRAGKAWNGVFLIAPINGRAA